MSFCGELSTPNTYAYPEFGENIYVHTDSYPPLSETCCTVDNAFFLLIPRIKAQAAGKCM